MLIDGTFRARLADFGLARVNQDPSASVSTSLREGNGTLRWMAPELLIPEQPDTRGSRLSTRSDVYALAMVMLEVWCLESSL